MGLVTENRSQVVVTVNGVSIGVWDKQEGGHKSADTDGYNPGGMAARKSKKGPSKRENAKVSRHFDDLIDLPLFDWLERMCEESAPMTIGVTILSPSKTPVGALAPLTGELIGVMRPEWDSEGNSEARIELEMLVLS
jgi:hypothetical protein